MKRILLFVLISIFVGCKTISIQKSEISDDDVIDVVINNFMESRKNIIDKYDFFYLSIRKSNNEIDIMISADLNKVSYIIEENGVGSFRDFPTKIIEKDGNLFFLYEKNKNASNEIIQTMYKYNFVDTLIVNTYIPEYTLSDSKKDCSEFYYKNNKIKRRDY